MCGFLQLVCPFFRNVRIATFSVEARAKEVADHLDRHCMTLHKNYRPDPITGQKPVANVVFARELLLQQGLLPCCRTSAFAGITVSCCISLCIE